MTHLSQFLDLDHFLKIPKFKNREIGTREIGYTCRFAKFNAREKSVFKKICESRNLIPAKFNTFKVCGGIMNKYKESIIISYKTRK